MVNRGDMAAHFHTAMAVLGGAAMRIEDAVVEGGGSTEPRSARAPPPDRRRRLRGRRIRVRIRGSEIAANSEVSPIALQVGGRLDGGSGEQRARGPTASLGWECRTFGASADRGIGWPPGQLDGGFGRLDPV